MHSRRFYLALNSFVLMGTVLLLMASYSYKTDKEIQELQTQLNLNDVYVKETYNNYVLLAQNINKFIFNDDRNLDIFKQAYKADESERDRLRQQLYDSLIDGYKRLHLMGFRQVHFHLPDNHSFLRLHLPQKYGDDLSDVRYSVKSVNETLKPIQGFEEGRVVNGFRFVFPLFDENGVHVGSVEASVSSNAFIQHIEQTYQSDVHFIVLKEVVREKLWEEEVAKHYAQSLENEAFFVELKPNEKGYGKRHDHIEYKKFIPLIEKYIKTEKKFSIFDGRDQILSFLPIRNIKENRVIAYFVIYDHNESIPEGIRIFKMTVVLILLFAFALLFLLRREHLGRIYIEKMNEDLEERIQAEVLNSQKRDSQMMEQSRLAQMGEMISMIAHQWRQPLGAISSTAVDMKMHLDLNTYDLEKKKDRERCQEEFGRGLDDIGVFVKSLTSTIDDFRNFYKPDRAMEIVSLCEPIEKSLGIIRAALEAESVKIEYNHICPEQRIRIHKGEMMQVFLNLFKNALDNFKEKKIPSPRLEILCNDAGQDVEVQVRDNGGGISEEIIDHIFDPYFSTKDEKHGTGLGLYMSKMIIEGHHNGKLRVHNEGDGACFSIILPKKDS